MSSSPEVPPPAVGRASELQAAYGREVPLDVTLIEGFDAPESIVSDVGDCVQVCLPPEGVEIDECSLFVSLKRQSGHFEVFRVYEHEFKA